MDGGGAPLVDHSFDPSTTDPVDAVFVALARTDRIDLTDAAPLASVVDPDALDSLFDPSGSGDVRVRFRYEGLAIELAGDGRVRVYDADTVPAPMPGHPWDESQSVDGGSVPAVDGDDAVGDDAIHD